MNNSVGTSGYINEKPRPSYRKEIKKLGIAPEPCHEHSKNHDEFSAPVIIRPDWQCEGEFDNWNTHYDFVKCPKCGWLIGKRKK